MSRMYDRRIEYGPSREDFFDSLRLGTEVQFGLHPTWSIGKKAVIMKIERVWEKCQNTWRIKFKMNKKTYEAFYSTSTRHGFLCKTDFNPFAYSKVVNGIPSTPVYTPLSDYELMVLINLASVVVKGDLFNVIRARLRYAVEGASYVVTEEQSVIDRVNKVLGLFEDFLLLYPKNEKEVLLGFKKLLSKD